MLCAAVQRDLPPFPDNVQSLNFGKQVYSPQWAAALGCIYGLTVFLLVERTSFRWRHPPLCSGVWRHADKLAGVCAFSTPLPRHMLWSENLLCGLL